MISTPKLISRRSSRHHDKTLTAFYFREPSATGVRRPVSLPINKPSPHPSSPPLKLSHPLLRALDFCRFHQYSAVLNQVLVQLLVAGLLFHPLAAGRALLALSSLPSSIPLAITLFFVLPYPDAFASNTLIRSLLAAGLPYTAITFYRRLVFPAAVAPNHFTFPLLLKLFSRLNLHLDGKSTHARITKLGFEADIFIRNSLIHMYACFSDIISAEKMFVSYDAIDNDSITYNSMIDGYVKNGMVVSARTVFDRMPERDVMSWNMMIAGYIGNGNLDAARELFWMMPVRDTVSWNSMIDGYARNGEVSVSRELFDEMPVRNLVSWNVLLALYARVKGYKECLDLFQQMLLAKEAKPNKATFVSVLTSCGNLGQLDRGKWIHSLIRGSSIEPDVLLLTALLTMYVKCGAIESAKVVFDQMPERNTVSWNSMIMGYGLHGQTNKALELFLEMEKCGSLPNEATFVCIISACTQSGDVLEGWWCFDRMVRAYNIVPNVEHVGCIVDLLGRSGLLKYTTEFVTGLTERPTKALWGALMSSCWRHSNWEVGKFVGNKLIEMMPEEVGPYIMLSNIWAAEGKWEEVEKIRVMIEERGLQKGAGVSLTERDDVFNKSLSENSRFVGSKKSIVYSLLSEMGVHLKVSWTEIDERRKCL